MSEKARRIVRAVLAALAALLIANGVIERLSILGAQRRISALRELVMDERGGVLWERFETSKLPNGIAAWAKVEGTHVDTAVMQGSGEFYLSHNENGDPDSFGVPYLDGHCTEDDGVRLVFGHHIFMSEIGFSELADAWKQDEFGQVGNLRWSTRTREETILEPLCALKVDKNYSAVWDFLSSDFDLQAWLTGLIEDASVCRSNARTAVASADQAIVFVTCSEARANQASRTLLVFTCANKT